MNDERDKKKFALSSAYAKELNTAKMTSGNFDSFSST
jgi:hypothetical protein